MSGVFGFPKPLCAQVILREIAAWLCSHPDSSVHEVNACSIDALTAGIFRAQAARLFSE